MGTIMPPEMLSSDGHYLEYRAAGVCYLERNYCKVLFY